MIFTSGGHEFDDAPGRVDRDAVWAFLSTRPDARGAGLGKELVAAMTDRGPGADFRWTLRTADAHDLYKQYGFAAPDETFMERRRRSASAG